ncbi:SDR family oxidoreductase [Sphingobium sp. TKS]|uniref:SDR family oxidoreductase n=1 Tax=Sphingobium sp. TKS TaxID=1315974 RepID=UPI003312FB0B
MVPDGRLGFRKCDCTARGKVPLRRIASPNDIAAAVVWLLSDEADYVTGISMPVDGGLAIV